MNREDTVSEIAKVWDRRAMEDELTHASIKIMAQHVEIEQLREANEMMLTDIRRTDVDMLAFKAEIERLRADLEAADIAVSRLNGRAELQMLMRENNKLRACLVDIATGQVVELPFIQALARAALAEEKKDD